MGRYLPVSCSLLAPQRKGRTSTKGDSVGILLVGRWLEVPYVPPIGGRGKSGSRVDLIVILMNPRDEDIK